MENPTAFDLNEAIRRWRAEFGSPSPLNAVELEELEAHLRDHVSSLEAGGMTPEPAFRAAVKQLGDRQRVATEFAKINPQRVWLERAIWMLAGILLFHVLGCLAFVPSNIILNYGLKAQWNPTLCFAASRFCYVLGVATMAVLCWFCLTRRVDWVRWLGRLSERKPLLAGAAMMLALWGIGYLSRYYGYILERYLPQLHAWLMPTIQPNYPDQTVMMLVGIAENVIWAAALCMLAAHVLLAHGQRSLLPAMRSQQLVANPLWLERALWMAAGAVLALFVIFNIVGFGVLPGFWMQRILGRSAVLEHVFGGFTTVLELALWAMPLWLFWILATRRPKLGSWLKHMFRDQPLKATLGVAFLLNLTSILALLLWSTGIPITSFGSGPGLILWKWREAALMLISRIAPALLLLALVRWRMKLREAR